MKTVTLKKQVKVISLMSSCLEVLWNILSFVYQASPTLCYQNSPLIEVLFKVMNTLNTNFIVLLCVESTTSIPSYFAYYLPGYSYSYRNL